MSIFFFFSSRRRHTRCYRDWSSDVCSSDLGHGGHGAMSMDAMVADMRNRFLVAVVFSIPILLWSPIGRDVLGFTAPAPFGLRDDVWSLLLSLPVIFYSCAMSFIV